MHHREIDLPAAYVAAFKKELGMGPLDKDLVDKGNYRSVFGSVAPWWRPAYRCQLCGRSLRTAVEVYESWAGVYERGKFTYYCPDRSECRSHYRKHRSKVERRFLESLRPAEEE
jgi:hypothetical protein